MGEKELKKYNRKGIFTLTQLSCTFRPRKRGKRVKRTSFPHYAALQALAIREKKVHVYGTPDIPQKPVQVFFDAEGDRGRSFRLLARASWSSRATVKRCTPSGRTARTKRWRHFDAFLDLLEGREDFVLFHYGSYERKLLKRMRKVVKRKGLVDRILANAVNVLTAIHASVYFPTFSNGLKEIGRYFGCTWTDENASGLQSLVWRARWEQAREPVWKDTLLTYNAEDCVALRKVTRVRPELSARPREAEGEGGLRRPPAPLSSGRKRSPPRRASASGRLHVRPPGSDHVNSCAYFDYQREKVYLRTSKAVRRCLPEAA